MCEEDFTPTNVMDRWILSFTQSLLTFVKEEMASECGRERRERERERERESDQPNFATSAHLTVSMCCAALQYGLTVMDTFPA